MKYKITNSLTHDTFEWDCKNMGHAARIAAAIADTSPYRIDKYTDGSGGTICNAEGIKAEFVKNP